jgi:hypothetical protein
MRARKAMNLRRTHRLEAEFAEFTARHLWRFVRPFVGRHLAQRCKHCILSEAYAPLNADGVCAPCAEYEARGSKAAVGAPVEPALRERLDGILRTATRTGPGAYDALVLVSGGKDSAYTLHRLQQEYPGLRLITLLVNNGFMSPVALENADHLMEKFDLPHVTWKLKPAFVEKAFRHALTHLDRQSAYSIVDLMDACMTFDSAMEFAVRLDIPLVISGLAKVQTEFVYGPYSVEMTPSQYRAPLVDQLDSQLSDIFDDTEMAFMYQSANWHESRQPRFLLPFTIWNPDEEEVLREVDRLGLISKARSRPLLTNNALIPVIGMAEVARFGYCSWEIEFAQMVREGKSERNYWLNMFEMLEYSTKTGRFVNKTVEQTLDRLGLTRASIGIGA